MVNREIHISVVGHTNAGKTSLLRTLLRRKDFGEVSAMPSTTRDVSYFETHAPEAKSIYWYDTPGLEESRELYDDLQTEVPEQLKHDGPGQIEHCINQSNFVARFSQESKVLKQLMASDAALVVIDTRSSILEKLLDELSILKLSGKPMIPILNFSSAEVDVARWEDALRKMSIHNFVGFDTLRTPISAEEELFTQLASVLPKLKHDFEGHAAFRQQARQQRLKDATGLVAELIAQAGTLHEVVAKDDEDAAKNTLKEKVEQLESQYLQEILSIYGFTTNDAMLSGLPLVQGAWEDSLFDQDTWRKFGVSLVTSSATGGAIGFGFDVMTGGLSAGLGTVIGGALGLAYQGQGNFGQRVKAKFEGKQLYVVESSILTVLVTRQLALIQALQIRGVAAQEPVTINQSVSAPEGLSDYYNPLRKHMNWGDMSPAAKNNSNRYYNWKEGIQTYLESVIHSA